ncbi:MAG: fumarylacetoacetate hydrolase family protein [Deltaproteobacteria bacterium]|nr:fumarylacetoacetate hydrolase family protein [Deltaproteobacteria bacterium]
MAKFVRVQTPIGISYGRMASPAGPVELLNAPAWEGGQPTGQVFGLSHVKLLAPCEPTKIVCVAHNFLGNAQERKKPVPKRPLVFFKPPSSLVGPGDAIVRPRASQKVQHEAELAIVIGRRCHRVTAAYARAFGAGVTCFNDVTARDIQAEEGYFARCKGFDTFSPLGPWIEEGPVDIDAVTIRCKVNGETRQTGTGKDLIFEPWELVAYVSTIMTLNPGDIVSTGTPIGTADLLDGDVCEVEIDGVGSLKNPVVNEA